MFIDKYVYLHVVKEPVLTAGPQLITCHEDDEFVSALDKLMSEDVTTIRRNESFKGLDAAIPLHLKGAGVKTASGRYSISLDEWFVGR